MMSSQQQRYEPFRLGIDHGNTRPRGITLGQAADAACNNVEARRTWIAAPFSFSRWFAADIATQHRRQATPPCKDQRRRQWAGPGVGPLWLVELPVAGVGPSYRG